MNLECTWRYVLSSALLRGFGEALRFAVNVQILCEDTSQKRENQGFNVK